MAAFDLTEVLIAVGVFTAVVLALVLLILTARLWLAPTGEVEVLINGRQRASASAGNKLLWELASQGVYLPAACGGRGTCGQCRIVVRAGAGPLLPTEAVHIRRREAIAGVRLACMTTVQSRLEIEVPDELLDARRWICEVQSSQSVTTFLKQLVLALPEGERIEFEAGDYVLLEAPAHKVRFADFDIGPEYRADWQRYKLLELESHSAETVLRAYSLANPPSQAQRIELVVRIATPPPYASMGTPPGRASSFLFSLVPGDKVAVSGPFGHFHARASQREMVMIAGGAGIAPIRSILLDQLEHGSQRRISLWYGVRNRRELCYHDELAALAAHHDNFYYAVALSEQDSIGTWDGHRGFIHDVVNEHYLGEHAAPEDAEYYICGPPVMSAAVLKLLDDLGVEPDNIFLDDFGS